VTYPPAHDTDGWRALLSSTALPEDRTRLVLARADAAGCHVDPATGSLVIPPGLDRDAAVSLYSQALLNNVNLRLHESYRR
jgi:hypothetical protein